MIIAFAFMRARIYPGLFFTTSDRQKYSSVGHLTAKVILLLLAATSRSREYKRRIISDFMFLTHFLYMLQFCMFLLYAGICSFEHSHEAIHVAGQGTGAVHGH